MIRKPSLAALVTLLACSPALAQGFDDPAAFEHQRALMKATPQGPEGRIWEQWLDGKPVDTARYKKPGPWRVCFSNAGVNNPWRVVGWIDMQAEVDLHKADIKEFTAADAEGKDDKQIADINAMVAGHRCDVLIVSPNTTEALTPAVEQACKQLPVVVFDRGVRTACPVTFIHPIGGYAFGSAAADYIAANAPKGASVLALRILPGVDVLETRWAAARRIFNAAGIKVAGAEFTDGDRAKTKSIVEDYINKGAKIDAVWMDAGATSVAAIEAFEDAGAKVPIVTGEDQQDFLQKWQADSLNAVAPTYPTFQWRTPIIAALHILKGEPVIGPEWVLPEPTITKASLAKYVNPKMPPLHYAMCGCETMPGYPQRWGGK